MEGDCVEIFGRCALLYLEENDELRLTTPRDDEYRLRLDEIRTVRVGDR